MHSLRASSLSFLLLLTFAAGACQEAGDLGLGSAKKGSSSSSLVQGEPRFLYAVNHLSESLSVYQVTNQGQGLQHLSFALTGKNPVHVSTSPDGSLAVVCNFGADHVTVYRVDGVTGQLSQGSDLQVGDGPVASLFHPSGSYLYVANAGSDSVSKFLVDATNGTLTRISSDSNAGVRPQAMLLSKDGRYLYMINSMSESLWTYAIDDQSGDLSPFTSMRLGFAPLDLVLHDGGAHLYVVGGVTRGSLLGFNLDLQSGRPTAMTYGRQDLGLGTLPVSVQVGTAGDLLYVALRNAGEIAIVELEKSTGLPSGTTRFPLGRTARPEALLLQAGTNGLLVAESSQNEVLMLDLGSPKFPVMGTTMPAIRTQALPLSLAYGFGKKTTGSRSDFAFVANSGDGSLSAYSIDSKPTVGTGKTTELRGSPIRTGNLPEALALHPSRNFLYAAGRVGISIFTFDSTSQVIETRPGILLGDHVDLIMGRRGEFLYGVEGGSLSKLQPYRIRARLGTLDKGDLKSLPTGRFSARGALDPTGRFLYVPNRSEDSLSNFVIDIRSGQPLPVLKTETAKGPSAVAVHPSGRWAYVTLSDAGYVAQYSIHPFTGRLGLVTQAGLPVFPLGSRPVDLAIDPSGRWLYVADPVRQEIALFSIDPYLGAIVTIGSQKVYKAVQRLRVDASGRFLFVTYDNGSRGGLVSYALDPVTGELGASSTSLTGKDPRSIVLDRRND